MPNTIAPLRKPLWLNKKIDFKDCREVKNLLKDLSLNTVCEEAMCPNISECFKEKTATFLILGNICTRNCDFCAVKKGIPAPIRENEPERVKEAVKRLKLKHVVITSVTRDDLADGGAGIFAKTIYEIRHTAGDIRVEALIPDFKGDITSIKKVIAAKPDIFAHNLETVPRLYKTIRKKADYERSLKVLKTAKDSDGSVYTKSGIMLGLGEAEGEVLDLFEGLRSVNCDFLSIGQYLAPSLNHYPVNEYIAPKRFEFYKEKALKIGFSYVESAPYARSSYHASRSLENRFNR